MPFCEQCGAESQSDGARYCAGCGAPLAGVHQPKPLVAASAADPTRRKTVTLLFSDVSGSTAMGELLDPESVREIMNRYFEVSRAAIERHGGTVEKYVGDAVMAAFGIPTAYEDDALRAVRAAAEIRDALDQLDSETTERLDGGLRVRIGINTGEVIAGDPSLGQAFASGDAVNVAARLEQAAPPGEILISERTHGLVRDAVETEAIAPFEAKGKSEPIAAYRLTAVSAQKDRGIARRLDAPLVGRESELGELEAALAETIRSSRPKLLLLLGVAGLGKSRLASALAERVGENATVIAARCPSYGEGALFPFQQALLRLADIQADDNRVVARDKLQALVPKHDKSLLETLAGFLHHGDRQVDIRDASWGIRRLLDDLTTERPLLVIIDDAHWADKELLKLAVDISNGTRPLLILLLARPELLEDQSSRRVLESVETTHLGLLAGDSEEQIARGILGDGAPADIIARICDRAAGNPLYVEELAKTLAGTDVGEQDAAEISLPDSLDALLTARVESLPTAERETLEVAAVAEDSVWPAAIVASDPDRFQASIESHMESLVRHGLLVGTRSILPGEPQFRFAHVLMREAAYRSITKRRRARLHEQHADWLTQVQVSTELNADAAIGRHLEASCGYLAELGGRREARARLAARATRHLLRGAFAASEVEDDRFAADLLERACRTASNPAERAEVWANLAVARFHLDLDASIETAETARAAATEAGEPELEWVARLRGASARSIRDGGDYYASLESEATAAIAALPKDGNDWALAYAWGSMADLRTLAGECAAGLEAVEHATAHAKKCERRRVIIGVAGFQIYLLAVGPAHVTELAQISEAYLSGDFELSDSALLEADALGGLGLAHAAMGDPQLAGVLFERALEIQQQLEPMSTVTTRSFQAWSALWEGRIEAAERVYRDSYAFVTESGHESFLASMGASLGDALARQGRTIEAREWLAKARTQSGFLDIDARVRWRLGEARARVSSEPSAAIELAVEATRIADSTDMTPLRADSWHARADVAVAMNERDEALRAAGMAESLYRSKGIVPAAEKLKKLAVTASALP